MKRKDDTLRDTLLAYARIVAEAEGIDAINIRRIAGKAGIAASTVYNYFSNKDEILLALTEEYWSQTLLEMKEAVKTDSFSKQLEEIYAFLREHMENSAGIFMKSLGNVETAGEECMASMQQELQEALVRRMEADKKIRKDAWNHFFTKEQYARFLMINITALLRTKASDIQFFIEVVKRTIY